MGRTPKLPPKEEWDFRQVDDLAIPDAAIYEYARSAKKLSQCVNAWFRTEIDGRTIREHLNDYCKEYQEPTTLLDEIPGALGVRIIEAGIAAGIHSRLLEIILENRPDFPKPWLRWHQEYEKNDSFSRVCVLPMDSIARRMRDHPKLADVYERPSEAGGTCRYYMTIDWDGASAEEVIKHVTASIRKEAKKHVNKRGTAGKAPAWKLKNLAAWRLREAGFTYKQAQEALRKCGHNEGGRFLPVFADESSWSDAITAAASELATLDR